MQILEAPLWADNQWVYSAGTQSNTYFLLIRSGAREGSCHTIIGNGSSTLTLDSNSGSLTGIVPGDSIAVIPYWTLGTIFPGGNGIHPSPTASTRATEIFILTVDPSGLSSSVTSTYYFRNGAWRQVGQGNVIKNDFLILPGMFMIVRNNFSVATEVTTHGFVLHTPWNLRLRRSSIGAQDNALALPRPNAISLNASGLIQSCAFQASLSAATRTDELFIFDSAPAINESPVSTYYYRNGSWRKVGSGSVDMGEEEVFQPGSGFIIRTAPGPEASLWKSEPGY